MLLQITIVTIILLLVYYILGRIDFFILVASALFHLSSRQKRKLYIIVFWQAC